MKAFPVLAAFACLLAVSCGDDRGRQSAIRANSIPLPPTSPPGDSVVHVTREPCPATGKWAACTVEQRLRRSGFVASRMENESPVRAGFSIKPVVYKLGSGRLEVFIYDDESALRADMDKLDTLAVAPPGSGGQWGSPPGLIRTANLAAVFTDQTARQAERLILALTAGPPSGR